MMTKRQKTWMAAVCALAIAGAAQAAFPWFKGGDDATLSKDQMWAGWRTCPNEEEWLEDTPCRMAGEVIRWIKEQDGSQGYELECDGISYPVWVPRQGMQKVALPIRNGVFLILGVFHPEGGFIEEQARFSLDKTEADWNDWQEEAGYAFAVENAFRQLAVVADNGKRMPALDAIDWQVMRSDGKDLFVSEEAALLSFLKANQSWWKRIPGWCAKNQAALLVAGGIVLALLAILAVVLVVNRPRCPKCGRLLRECTCGGTGYAPPQSPALCPRCGRPVAECVCGGTATPPGELCPHCGLPKDQCVCTQPICKGCGMPKNQCVCTQAPTGMALLIDGVPLAQSDATVVLSPFALKVAKGGKNAGLVIPLPKMATVLGREKGTVPGAFIYLDMSDRKSVEKQCSRKYAKVTAHGDSLDVEVVATSGNDVRVDGQTVSNAGEVLQAKAGSRIELNPDWEFEVVSSRTKA